MARNRKGTGRLVPVRPTGLQYRVKYGIHIVEERKHGSGIGPAHWERCSVRSEHAHKIPAGEYFLHADEGGVFQLKYTGNSWQYLAAA